MIRRRLLSLVPLFIIVSLLVFTLEAFLPGDTATLLAGGDPTPAKIAEIDRAYHLNDPLPVRYWHWLVNVLHGNLGVSLYTKTPVAQLIGQRWPVTLSLLVGSVLFGIVMGSTLGIIAALRSGGWIDRAVTMIATLGIAVPYFVFGMFLIVVVSVKLKLLPINGYVPPSAGVWNWVKHLILPVIALSAGMTAQIARHLRGSLIQTLHQDYVRFARAQGLSRITVLRRYALPMASSPVLSVVSVNVAQLVGGTVLIEQIFGLPGLGQMIVNALVERDLPVIEGIVPLAVLVSVLANLGADILREKLNPVLKVSAAT